ncbi:GNAT family N-acetyltransferase [Methanolobus sp. WCC5]|jgi:putative acetyltransferase|uniref:GNAT family N-acetyltransferase n=1 Tax=Methanolobus sp. WCC5 TaxID=3125785 RepID=UPI003255815B
MYIREANRSDFNDIMIIEKEAFPSEDVADLVGQLLTDKSAEPVVSLLAFKDDEAVGHILFTRAAIDAEGPSPSIYILAPLAVRPDHQRQGIGGMLITEGLKKLKEMEVEMVFVLGHEEYYPRHGFIPDSASLGFTAPFPIPEKDANAWMVQALTPEGFSKVRGTVVCADSLNRPEHWRE